MNKASTFHETSCWLRSRCAAGISLVFFAGLSAVLSEQPQDVSTETVIASGLRGGALVPTHGRGTPAQNREMLEAMEAWNAHDWAKGVEKLHRIWQNSPNSPWAAEAELHEACYLKYTCQYEASEERFLSVLAKYADNPGVRKKAFYYLPHLYAQTGRLRDAVEVQKMLGEYELNWQERQFLENQLRLLSTAQKAEDENRLCGVKALALAQEAAESSNPEKGVRDISFKNVFGKRQWALARSSHADGYSVADLTRKGGGKARRVTYQELKQLAKPGRPVIAYLDTPQQPRVYENLGRLRKTELPRLTGHFVVVEKVEDNYLEALDPEKSRERWDACMFQARWSGIVVLLPGTPGSAGQAVPANLAETLRGGCCGSTPPDPCAGDDALCSCGSSKGANSEKGPIGNQNCLTCGAPGYMFNLPSANLAVIDTPMWYPQANGPEMRIHLVHNRINSGILSDTNSQSMLNYYIFGNKWSFNYSSFIKIAPGGNIQVIMSSGLVLEYLPDFTPVNIRNPHILSLEGGYYRLTLDGSRLSYFYSTNATAAAGQQVEAITDRFGHILNLHYNGSGQVTNITDDAGRYFKFSYNSGGHVTNVTDSIGRFCSFGYSANSNLVSMTDMGGYTTALEYDSHNWVTNIVYPNSSVMRFSYEVYGYSVRMFAVNSLDHTNEYFYDGSSRVDGPITLTDASSNTWYYLHDVPSQRDNRIPAIYYEGVNATNTSSGADQWTYREFASDTHNLIKESQPATAVRETGTLVANGLVRTFAYGTNGWVITENWLTNNIVMATWSNAYDGAGNRIYAKDPLGAITRTVFANDLPVSITNALGAVTKMQYDDHGNLKRSINPRLAETKWAYDARGLSTNVMLPDGTAQWMNYDSAGRLTTVTDPVGLTISNAYDNLDRITGVYYPDNTSTRYDYSCCGLNAVTDRLERPTTYQRDILNRVTNVVDAANQQVGFRYGPGGEITNLIVWVDGSPRTTKFDYTSTNGFTRLTRRTSPLGKTTDYDYWFRGWLKSRTDGAGRVTQYQYDVLGRLKEINYPGNTNVTMTYDPVGHVTSLANNNASSTFAYDILGRLTNTTVSLAVPGMTNVQYALEYQYDATGNVTNRTLRGLSGFTQAISTRYDYDSMNRLTLVTNPLASATYTYDKGRLATKQYGNRDAVTYAYDLESRLTNMAIRAGGVAGLVLQQFDYMYDSMGMMLSQTVLSQHGAGYSAQRMDYGYDAVYQLTSEVVRVDGGAGVTNTWSYDAAGNVKTASGKLGTAQATVNDDNELTEWTQAVRQTTVTGQVDAGPASNKWFASTASARGRSAPVSMQDGSFGIVGVPVNAGANALTAVVQDVSGNTATQIVNFTVSDAGSSTFSYDANGNLSSVVGPPSSGTFTYGYDAENRLVKAISNNVTVLECWYDGAGHRIAKREIIGTQTNTVQYVWDGWNLIALLGSDGQVLEFYMRGLGLVDDVGSLIAETHYENGSSTGTYYLQNNHRGDVILASQGVNTVASLSYGPFGELREANGTYNTRFRFSSKEFDTASGFYHFPRRYYAPALARWLSKDPLVELPEALPGGPNSYDYVRNNPLSNVDPMGLMPACLCKHLAEYHDCMDDAKDWYRRAKEACRTIWLDPYVPICTGAHDKAWDECRERGLPPWICGEAAKAAYEVCMLVPRVAHGRCMTVARIGYAAKIIGCLGKCL